MGRRGERQCILQSPAEAGYFDPGLRIGTSPARLREDLVHTGHLLREVLEPAGTGLVKDALRLLEHQVCRIAVIGQIKAGKSSFINAFVQQPELLPTDVNPWTTGKFCRISVLWRTGVGAAGERRRQAQRADRTSGSRLRARSAPPTRGCAKGAGGHPPWTGVPKFAGSMPSLCDAVAAHRATIRMPGRSHRFRQRKPNGWPLFRHHEVGRHLLAGGPLRPSGYCDRHSWHERSFSRA